EQLAIALERAVLALAKGAPVRGRVLEERDEARDPDDVDAGRPAVGMEREAGEHHISAVRAAPEHGGPLGADPVVESDDVEHGVEPPPDVVQVLVAPAVAG